MGLNSSVKIGDKIWVFRLGDNVIIPAKVAKTYKNSDEIWWEPIADASNGKWLTCSHRTNVYFSYLEGAKMHASIFVKLEKEAAIVKFDKAIAEIKTFEERRI